MKFAPSKLLPETISFILSALIYDEEYFASRVRELFGFEVVTLSDKTQRYFYAVSIDRKNNRTFVTVRGTDGKNAIGRFLSWMTNLRVLQNKWGFHRGFWSIAECAMRDAFMRIVGDIYISGHSQGGGVSVAFLAMLVRKIVNKEIASRYVQADLWSSPPAVSEKGKREIDRYIADKLCRCFNWIESGDLIHSKALRKKRGILSGRDVGVPIELPNIIPDQYGLFDKVSHSPTVVAWAYKDYVRHDLDKAAIAHIINEGWIEK